MEHKKCPKCDSDVEDTNRYCGKCGHDFDALRQRHWSLTAWLAILIITSFAAVIFYIFTIIASHAGLFSQTYLLSLKLILYVNNLLGIIYYFAPSWILILLVIASLANIYCLIALFQWNKCGLYGYIAIRIVVFIINMIVDFIYCNLIPTALISSILHQVIITLGGIVVLCVVLQIGKENKDWLKPEHCGKCKKLSVLENICHRLNNSKIRQIVSKHDKQIIIGSITLLVFMFTATIVFNNMTNNIIHKNDDNNNIYNNSNILNTGQSGLNIQVAFVNNYSGNVHISLDVTNNSNESVYVSSSDFTLSSDSGDTINPTLDSVESFDGIDLQPGQRTSGILQFQTENVSTDYLNYNGLAGEQKIEVDIPSSD